MSRTLASSLVAASLLALSGAASADHLHKDTDEARQLAARFVGQIRGELVRELEATGPLRGIVVCRYSVPEITSTLSRQNGLRITRVSLKPRNRAIAEADAWEQGILLGFEKRVSKGEKVEGLEHAAIVHEPTGRYFRYMKAIPMEPACMACHGDKASNAIKALLDAEYPHDKATGYAVGRVRGAVSIKKPL